MESRSNEHPVSIIIHGGAGTILRERLTADVEQAYREALGRSVQAGHDVLVAGGTSREAVVAAVTVMEDSDLFNAGVGSVFTHEGTVEMDASVMDGRSLDAGAVTGIKHIRNPIQLAASVLTASPHVILMGEGAEQFAREQGFELVDNSTFHTERRRRQLQELLDSASGESRLSENGHDDYDMALRDKNRSTVGAVAYDRFGDIAVATSTGGMTNKRFGRVGDTPVIGAGTYADNAVGGISATGHGEFFIRAVVGHDICARAMYKGINLQQAADEVMEKLAGMGGDGGVVGIDAHGDIVISFNAAGMYRAWIDKQGEPGTAIFR
ncbi:MAG TPA: isoaspartyl peptidase/L-asparaginase [Pseudomonadales bacterium]|nr:isoaspartyl peptidase/L-asparaginase [Pseudomonadales bacterium]